MVATTGKGDFPLPPGADHLLLIDCPEHLSSLCGVRRFARSPCLSLDPPGLRDDPVLFAAPPGPQKMDGSQQIIMNFKKTLGKTEVALGTINEAIVWTNREGSILWCNSPFDLLVCRNHIAILGPSFTEVMRLQLFDACSELDQHPLYILKTSGTLEKTMYDYARSGVQLTLQISGNIVNFYDDDYIYIFCIEDVTKIRRAQDLLYLANENLEARAQARAMIEAEAANRAKKEIFSPVSATKSANRPCPGI